MKDFSDIFANATAAVGDTYFLLPILGGNPIQRERVYCYELYHQMRSVWSSPQYVLNGELDKSGHPKLKDKLGALKPDFLVHSPGSMEENYAAIEVKPAVPSRKSIRKDLKSLVKLSREARYRRCLYLIYGRADTELVDRIRDIAKTHAKGTTIELWMHARPGQPAAQVAVLNASR